MAATATSHAPILPPPSGGRIDTTTQQIKNALVAALTECGLVEHSPLPASERQMIAIDSVLIAGRRALTVLTAYAINPAKVDRHHANEATVKLNAVLDELKKEFGR